MDQDVVAAIRPTLLAKPTADLRQTYEAANLSVWVPEAFEAMRQILIERGEVDLPDLDSLLARSSHKPARRKSRWKPGLVWTLAGMVVGALILPAGMFGGQAGRILLGAFGIGPVVGILLLFLIIGLPLMFVDEAKRDDVLKSRSTLFLWLGALAVAAGMVVGGILAAMGVLFDWWIWPLACLCSIGLGAFAGVGAHRWWSRRGK